MAELAVAGSVVGIISLGIQVTQSLTDFYKAYRGRESDIANIAAKLTNLLGIFESLRGQLIGRKFRADEKSLLDKIEDSIETCEENIQELKTKIEKFNVSSGSSNRVKTKILHLAYPFKQSTLRKLDADIDEILLNLSLALAVLQQGGLDAVRNDIEEAKAVLDLVRTTQISSTIRAWLKAPDATTNYSDACKLKHPRTGLTGITADSACLHGLKPRGLFGRNQPRRSLLVRCWRRHVCSSRGS